jgi:hypothetical protein
MRSRCRLLGLLAGRRRFGPALAESPSKDLASLGSTVAFTHEVNSPEEKLRIPQSACLYNPIRLG